MKDKIYRNPPAQLWAGVGYEAAALPQPVRITHRFYQNGVLISERTYGPRGERRPPKKATLTYKVAFSFHNIYTLLEIASP